MLRTCIDVDHANFIDLFFVEQSHDVERITHIGPLSEFHCFDQTTVAVEQQDGDQSFSHPITY